MRVFNELGFVGFLSRGFLWLYRRLSWVPGSLRAHRGAQKMVYQLQYMMDGSFDRRFGTDTTKILFLDDLDINHATGEEGNWYQPLPASYFEDIMQFLGNQVQGYTFVDMGSGKGRVLLLASRYPFLKVIGIEFSRELHIAAEKNIARYLERVTPQSQILPMEEDATRYDLPPDPLFLFFFSPFRGSVLQQVLDRIVQSYEKHPRPIKVVFVGANQDSLDRFKRMGFHMVEIPLKVNHWQVLQFKAYLFSKTPSRK